MSSLPAEPTPESLPSLPARLLVAVRPPFLTASLVPVFIGLGTSHFSGTVFVVWIVVLTVLGPVLAQAGANVVNDYFDHLNGTDAVNVKRVFPFTGGSRMIQNGVLTPEQVRFFGFSLLATAVGCGVFLAYTVGPGLMGFVAAGLFIAWAYSAPPLRLNSRGWGELCIALAFGILIPLGADFVQRGSLSMLPVIAGFPFAMLVTNLLYINQFPDLEADAKAGKRHWVVRLGAGRARWIYPLLAIFGYGELLVAVFFGLLPVWTLLGLLAAPLSFLASRDLLRHADEPELLRPAIGRTIGAMMVLGIMLTIGFVVS